MNILTSVVLISVGIIILALSIDVMVQINEERIQKDSETVSAAPEWADEAMPCPITEKVSSVFQKANEARQNELGVVFVIGERPARPRVGGAHRRATVS